MNDCRFVKWKLLAVAALVSLLVSAVWAFFPTPEVAPSPLVPITDDYPLSSFLYQVRVGASGRVVALAGSLGYHGEVRVLSVDGELRTEYAQEIAVDYPQCCTSPPVVVSRNGDVVLGGSQELVLWSPQGRASNVSGPVLDGRPPLDLALDASGNILAGVSSDRKLHVYDLGEGRRLWSVGLAGGWWADVAVSPGFLALNSGSQVQIFALASSEPLASWPLDGGHVVPAVALSPTGTEVLATEGGYREGRVVYFTTQGTSWSYPLGEAGSAWLAFSPKGPLAVLPGEGRVLAFDLDGSLRWEHALGGRVYDAAFLEDGRLLVAQRGGVLLLDEGRPAAYAQVEGLPTALGTDGDVVAVILSPQGSIGGPKVLRLYALPSPGRTTS